MSVDVSKAEIGTARTSNADRCQLAWTALMRRTASEALQSGQLASTGVACRVCSGRGWRDSAGQHAAGGSVVGVYGFTNRGLKRSIWALASAIAASGSDHAKPTSSVGN